MSTTHTREPWIAEPDSPRNQSHWHIRFEGRERRDISINGEDRAVMAANANRIADCVNALAGISDPVAAIQQIREKLSIIAGAHPTARRANYTECMELAEQALALLTPNK